MNCGELAQPVRGPTPQVQQPGADPLGDVVAGCGEGLVLHQRLA